MTKAQLVKNISEKVGFTQKDTATFLEGFMDVVTEALVQGEKVQLVGFGTFEVRHRAERQGHNPQTQEPMLIPATKVPAFKAGKNLKEKVKAQ